MTKVAVLGATGTVGQWFVRLLAKHPWFEITSLAASERSAGREYGDVVRWQLAGSIPEEVRDIEVTLPNPKPDVDADIVFSALPSDIARSTEEEFAEAGYVVASNASSHRMDKDVPLIIPEVNADHLGLIEEQRRKGRDGFIITNPNCSVIIMTLALAPLMDFGIDEVRVATMQAVSGAGYEGVPSMGILDNVIPFISGEEEKMEREPLKILGEFGGDAIINADFSISASCHRVPILDGHTEAIWVKLREDVSVDEVKGVFFDFDLRGLDTPMAPSRPIIVREEGDRPQPRLDRLASDGMSVSVGRIRRDGKGIKYVALGHNAIRGAAGASILNAELLVKESFWQK